MHDTGLPTGMSTTTIHATRVRVPRVLPGEAVVVTRDGAPVSAVIAIEDLRILDHWKAALAVEAGELADDEFPDAATVARILGDA